MLILVAAWVSTLIITPILSPKALWPTITTLGLTIALFSTTWFFQQSFNFSNHLTTIDYLSSPLAVLSCWLFPLTLLASQNKILKEPPVRQRIYVINISLLQLITFLTFTTSDFMLFFILFEASLIPTMIVITRWGNQEHRLNAGLYLAFYTMAGAIPLLIFLINFYTQSNSLFSPLSSFTQLQSISLSPELFWIICNSAFLVKMPLYSLHLWLPKAHVEAPIAGSMILAGTLLKLGGYGIMRLSSALPQILHQKTYLLMFIATLGVLATSTLCLRQTDLKSLIAMSSVSHMNLVIIATLIHTPWSYTGATTMMIAHGLTSSALFCLANTVYERTNSRTMILLRGALLMFPLAAAWWLVSLLLNMALPPSINFMAEMIIMVTIFNWSSKTFVLIAANLILTTAYTLYTLWATQRGPVPVHLKTLSPTQTREHALFLLHILPALLLTPAPQLISP